MNPYIAVMTLLALSLFWNQPVQTSFEKRAVDDTKRILASELDARLPRLSFAEWFRKAVGPEAGTIWQLSECGDQVEGATNGASDQRACVQVNALLPDSRRVIVMISVGTFKQGIDGPPTFKYGVIDHKDGLRQIRRLRDLEDLILYPEKIPKRSAVILPEIYMGDVKWSAIKAYEGVLPPWKGEERSRFESLEDAEPPPPKPTERSKTQAGLRQGPPIVKPQPTYPRNNNAKRFNASGPVEVQVTIGITGRVTAAKAIKGHPLLREAAVEAARRWEFEPTTIDGAPMETQVTLTFIFTIPPE
jgi:TonB family protein